MTTPSQELSTRRTLPTSRYWALRDYLRRQSDPRLELSFNEIEEIIGNPLPPSAYAPRWWTNGKSLRNNPLWQEAWMSAGYDATLVRGSDRVEFRRRP
jgi:hypothetical protein